MRAFQDVFDGARLPLQLHAYSVVATAPEAGLVECITGAVSLDALKRRNPTTPSLRHLWSKMYGPPEGEAHRRALRNFTSSCAAWAVVCYFLQIKDRHNGNIMLHADGHIVHIDFGFLLYQTAVYDHGNTWLNQRIAEEGISAIDDAVAHPAASSEAVIEAPETGRSFGRRRAG